MGGARFAGFLVQRVIKMVVMVFAIIVANFLLIHAAPGDPASVIAGEVGCGRSAVPRPIAHASSASISRCRHSSGSM